MRMVPCENEAINETWIADRDRFGFQGIYSEERASQPMLRVNGELQPATWEAALAAAAEGLRNAVASHGGAAVGFLASPMATVEELYLLSGIARGLGGRNIDHRLRQLDFRFQDREGHYPGLGLAISDVERLEGALFIGSNLRQEMPLLAHRVRKAAIRGAAKIAFLNPRRFEYLFPVAAYGVAGRDFVGELAAVVRAAAEAAGKPLPGGLADSPLTDTHRALAAALMSGTRRAVILGELAQRHPQYGTLQSLGALLAELAGASFGLLTEGANAAGAYLAGAVPHREPGGARAAPAGLSARAMLEAGRQAFVLFGGLDPAADFAVAADSLNAAEPLIAVTTHLPEGLKRLVHVVLPIGSFAETSGTFVNIEGRWQSWRAAVRLVGESRPGWKVLRVLANLLNLPGFEYDSSEEVRDALKALCTDRGAPETRGALASAINGALVQDGASAQDGGGGATPGWIDVPVYQSDALVRRSEALTKTKDGQAARTVM